ncbi:hypothetical protein BJ684DRAFT_19873 [Piptocephalis cylindrospora]|uniref:Uncharacterized protein n=1 Tax=Piptocephalis cylindrospora TaxID=1907219 RepID=A0A4P9Y404_9FUNG|nr:hypothetical protein BJ684DRAFT_19873 [Piptocephalis cylindrospora]|eukprot:RKP13657.1 hypothetical protein BJ684DRAFT_19873 [Piptocephalis cylindrospora]
MFSLSEGVRVEGEQVQQVWSLVKSFLQDTDHVYRRAGLSAVHILLGIDPLAPGAKGTFDDLGEKALSRVVMNHKEKGSLVATALQGLLSIPSWKAEKEIIEALMARIEQGEEEGLPLELMIVTMLQSERDIWDEEGVLEALNLLDHGLGSNVVTLLMATADLFLHLQLLVSSELQRDMLWSIRRSLLALYTLGDEVELELCQMRLDTLMGIHTWDSPDLAKRKLNWVGEVLGRIKASQAPLLNLE